MVYLNLTKGFDPFGMNQHKEFHFEYESFEFFGGEPHIKFAKRKYVYSNINITITQRIQSFNDVGLLLVAVDALRRNFKFNKLTLFLPYFPGARQDRVMTIGEPLTVKVYADIINSLNFNSVIILDPHSDVTPALINNCIIISNHTFVNQAIHDIYENDSMKKANIAIISPDAGAQKKIYDLMKFIKEDFDFPNNNFDLIKCDKTRDVTTGNLSGFTVNTDMDLTNTDCIIVDDICDGGGTFIGLAEKLKEKGAKRIFLVVSHGLFSKGFKTLSKYFTKIYTTDSWRSDISMETPEIEKKSEIVKIIPIII